VHIPDGYLTPVTYGGLWALMIPIWLAAAHRIKSVFAAARIPFLAMASAFSLIVMTVAIPLPGGTTGHLCGTAVTAILLGPSAGIMASSVALTIQAVVFGDGGITALAANCFNIAFAGSVTAYYLHAGLQTVTQGLFRKARFRGGAFAVTLATYLAVTLSALLTAVELGIQPLIKDGYFPYSLRVTLPAVMLVHLSVIAPLEACMTALIARALAKWPSFQRAGDSA
jgi:cobalt/nickel transport system permease protein